MGIYDRFMFLKVFSSIGQKKEKATQNPTKRELDFSPTIYTHGFYIPVGARANLMYMRCMIYKDLAGIFSLSRSSSRREKSFSRAHDIYIGAHTLTITYVFRSKSRNLSLSISFIKNVIYFSGRKGKRMLRILFKYTDRFFFLYNMLERFTMENTRKDFSTT